MRLSIVGLEIYIRDRYMMVDMMVSVRKDVMIDIEI